MKLPFADAESSLDILREMWRQKSVMAALEVMHQTLGDAFQITAPSFKPVVFAGPEHKRTMLVSERHKFMWRNETDPVCKLLRHGVLVEDGESHDQLRAIMEPPLVRREVTHHIDTMQRATDAISGRWQDGETYIMLDEMRKIALIIIMETLFGVDFLPDLDRMWHPIMRTLKYISPGPWLVWPKAPRPGFRSDLQALDDYLFGIIKDKRSKMKDLGDDEQSSILNHQSFDLLDHLIDAGLDDDLIRDQMVTMMIAGHDTSTALLTWVLYLLGKHPAEMAQVQAEVDAVVGEAMPDSDHLDKLVYMDMVIKETLRLYPPIHVGNRRAETDLVVDGYEVPAGSRVMCSIYLSHRDEKRWSEPDAFKPERFARGKKSEVPPLTYIPFGGGPRNCIGAAFAQVESKIVLARIYQQFDLELLTQEIRVYMGATLEPRPGIKMRVKKRKSSSL